MKKIILSFFIAFCLIFALNLFANTKTFYLYADGNEVTELNAGLYMGDTENDIKLPYNYMIDFNSNFNENEPISASNLPYGTYFIGIIPTMSQTPYSDLTMLERKPIIEEIVNTMTIQESQLDFDPTTLTATTDDYIVKVNKNTIATNPKIYLTISPLSPGSMEVKFACNSHLASLMINCDYTNPTKVSLISSGGSYNQLYENYETIVVTAQFNHQKYLPTQFDYVYIWTLDGERLPYTTNNLHITKDMIKIGNFRLKLEIQNFSMLVANAEIVITTEITYEATLTHSGGDLNQTIGEYQPIQFQVSIPTQENYSVTWYLKKANTNIFKKLSRTWMHSCT